MDNLYLSTEKAKQYEFYNPPSIKFKPQKDITAWELYHLTNLMFRYTHKNYPSREELEGMDEGVKRHFKIKEQNG